jgi:hypothetical protein
VISIGKLGAGRSAAEYYLSREAGCELEYYTGAGERPGRWLGPAARALGLTGELDAAGRMRCGRCWPAGIPTARS